MTMTMTTPKPTVGMRFIHTAHCKGEHEPECIITRVSATTVYYQTKRGRAASADILVFGSKVKRLVVPEPPTIRPTSTTDIRFSG